MEDTPTPITAPKSTLRTILRGSSMPLFLFAAVLFGALLISDLFFLQRLTTVAFAGKQMHTDELESYASTLRAELATMTEERNQLVLPFHDPLYTRLREQKRAQMGLSDLRYALHKAAGALVADASAVHITSITYDVATGKVEVSGDVLNVGTRSITVLAAFTDAVESLPFVTEFNAPSFAREDDPIKGVHSPFTMSFIVVPRSL